MFDKVLIANRGEIAVRIIAACRELGLRTVAVHSTADTEALHVRLADERWCIGPPAPRDSYLNIAALLTACELSGAQAVHPGYGFLSENAAFAEALQARGLVFIGPQPAHIRTMGDKIEAKRTARELGLPVVPGSDGALADPAEAAALAARIGYPVIVKAAAGGGGRGMKVARDEGELRDAVATARAEAGAAFGDDAVYLEKYLARPRHVEVQVAGDGRGEAVALGERDCSLQRRHQKVWEEALCPALDDGARSRIAGIAAAAVARLGYRGVGTLEFLYEDGEFYFIEMNTRLQVEHPVTEALTGVDLVREQLRIARGEGLSVSQAEIRHRGHAIECRINAEDPATFAPSPGTLTQFRPAGGPGVRVDSAAYAGYTVPPHYDSLLAKLIVHGADRADCLARLARALDEFIIEGVRTTLPLLRELVRQPDIRAGRYDIHWLERYLSRAPGG